MALQLRPNCEYCDKDLPPRATDARICSYECTFCADCVESKLQNVCPNCGGGFAPRPIRPAKQWRAGRVHRGAAAVGQARASQIQPRGRRGALREGTGRARGAALKLQRHCERSEAIQSCSLRLDCFVASLLAMTKEITPPAGSCLRPRQTRRDSRRPGTSRASTSESPSSRNVRFAPPGNSTGSVPFQLISKQAAARILVGAADGAASQHVADVHGAAGRGVVHQLLHRRPVHVFEIGAADPHRLVHPDGAQGHVE